MSARKGITLSLLSSVLFSVLCYHSVFLYPLNGWQIAGWRAVTTALLLILALAFRKKMKSFWRYFCQWLKVPGCSLQCVSALRFLPCR
ncbi:MAG: hypothetical protein K0R96_38 [Pantoea agglomerans]|nr:hypothetical protein [Pantoea agglomerans]